MALLEDAAQRLVDTLEALDAECQDAQKTLAGHHDDLAAIDGDVATAWDALAEDVTAFLDAVSGEQDLLAEDGHEAQTALRALRGDTEAAQAQTEAEAAGSRDEVQALAAHLRGLEPSLDTLITSGAEAPFLALQQLADDLHRQLEQAVADAREFLTTVVNELHILEQDLEERLEHLRTQVADASPAELQLGLETWQAHVEELETLVRDKFAELPDNAQEVVDYAMDECVRAHQDEFDQVLSVLPDIEQAIEQLRETVEETSVDVGQEGHDALAQNGDTLEEALTRTAAALDRVKALLAEYTFVAP